MVEAMLETIKVRTLEDNRTMFTIDIDATKVAKVMTVNHKQKFIVRSKCPCHMIATLNLSNEQIDDICKQREVALIKTELASEVKMALMYFKQFQKDKVCL